MLNCQGCGREMTQAFRLNWDYFSLQVAEASLLIPFRLHDADDDWDEVTEQLQAIEWGDGMRPGKAA